MDITDHMEILGLAISEERYDITNTYMIKFKYVHKFPLRSDLDSTRRLGVPNFKKKSAYNRGPRSKEVYLILGSNYSQSDFYSERLTTY
jgi:hypothetical protein